jgi:hypothetical protein
MRKIAIAIPLVAGCATQGVNTYTYTPATSHIIKNEKTVPRPHAAVWDELVRELSKSFYVINNIERESRIINVSFNSNSPSDYVDCGRTVRTYTESDKREVFHYAVAESARYKIAGDSQPRPEIKTYAFVTRQPSLDGRSNIYVAPDPSDSGKTLVSVNTRYVVSVLIRREAFAEHVNGQVRREALPEQTFSFMFSTNKATVTTSPGGGDSVTCSGRGRLETDILDMVR